MGKIKLWQEIKGFIASITFKIMLWALEMTEKEYWKRIYKQESENLELKINKNEEIANHLLKEYYNHTLFKRSCKTYRKKVRRDIIME